MSEREEVTFQSLNSDCHFYKVLIKFTFLWLIKIKCMRIEHIISDDQKMGHNSRFSGTTYDVEHTIFGHENQISGRFYAQNALNGRTGYEASPHIPEYYSFRVQTKDCMNPRCVSYPSATPRTTIWDSMFLTVAINTEKDRRGPKRHLKGAKRYRKIPIRTDNKLKKTTLIPKRMHAHT